MILGSNVDVRARATFSHESCHLVFPFSRTRPSPGSMGQPGAANGPAKPHAAAAPAIATDAQQGALDAVKPAAKMPKS